MFSQFFPSRSKSSTQPAIENNIVASYDFTITFKVEDLPYERVADDLRNAINEEFARQVESSFKGLVVVRLEPIGYGSVWGTVLLTLAAGVTIYQFIAQYRDFYDSLVLLRHQLRALIHRVLRERRPLPPSDVSVTLSSVPALMIMSAGTSPVAEPLPLYSKAFFWYLFVTNLVVIAVLIALVYRAVAAMYFKTP
jgi:hypothetical protein